LYNSLGRRVEDFIPSGDVTGMYSCGPTVYVYPHLGNMRAYVSADTVRRALRWKGVRVKHVVNITDVGHAVADTDTGEDKMEVAAARERRSVLEIAEFYTQAFFADLEGRRDPEDLTLEERHTIEQLVADRTQARKERDWPRADQIRAALDDLGVQVTDTPEGPTWQLR
jgi:cysteinyl-tRNA synthetase